tara:strand:+ start:155 stop:316 length:162 start_codon:yes stop_codon:yes gene_type:complete
MKTYEIKNDHKHLFNNDDIVVLRDLFTGLVDMIALALDQNLASPGPYVTQNLF